MRRSRAGVVTAVVLLIGLMGAAYMLGYVTHLRGLFPSSHILALKDRVTGKDRKEDRKAPAGPRRDVLKTTIHLPLRIDEVAIPRDRPGSGGGLTSVGEELVLLTHEGRLFIVNGLDVTPANIAVPDYGLEGYRIAAEGKYSHLNHFFQVYRYNDVLFYSTSAGTGLAISYTEYLADEECYGTTVARLRLPDGVESLTGITRTADDWEILHRTRPCLPLKEGVRALSGEEAGARLAFMAPDRLLMTSGSYAWNGMSAPTSYEQDMDADYGKILEINIDDGQTRIVSLGHRNPQGILVDRDGVIWSVEHGPRGGDELNRIVATANYGWPLTTLGTRYNTMPVASAENFGHHSGFEAPVYAWVPSIAVSNLTQADGFDPAWDGDLLVASLKAGTLFRVRVSDEHVQFVEPIALKQRIRYAHQHSDGRIALWTDSGILMFLRRGETDGAVHVVESVIGLLRLPDERRPTLQATMNACAQCHSFIAGDDEAAPGLGRVYGAPVASTGYQGYSDALRARSDRRWTVSELSEFLAAPAEYAPGTHMPDPELSPETIGDVIAVLEALRSEEIPGRFNPTREAVQH